MAEQRKQRSAQQKLEIVLAGMRGDRSVRDVCREHDVSEALYYNWRDKILEGGKAASGGQGRAPGREGASARRSASWSGPWGARPTSWRSRGKHCGAGSETARRPVPRAGRRGDRKATTARVMQVGPPGDLPHPEEKAGRHQAAGHRDGRPGDRRGREGQPDRRHPHGRGPHEPRARSADLPQAGPAGDAGRGPAAAPPALRPPSPARLLPGRASRPALAHGHDLGLGRRARLVLPERDRRLLHPRDLGLRPRPALPPPGGRGRGRRRRRRPRDRARSADPRHG